jgi:hypothetical protein
VCRARVLGGGHRNACLLRPLLLSTLRGEVPRLSRRPPRRRRSGKRRRFP